MSKTKKWTIQHGEIVPVSPLGCYSFVVEAPTKGEAQRKMLSDLLRLKEFSGPILVVKNNAFLLISHTGTCFSAESGDLARVGPSGHAYPLCSASHATFREAMEDSSFKYYSSDEYQKNK